MFPALYATDCLESHRMNFLAARDALLQPCVRTPLLWRLCDRRDPYTGPQLLDSTSGPNESRDLQRQCLGPRRPRGGRELAQQIRTTQKTGSQSPDAGPGWYPHGCTLVGDKNSSVE